MVCGVAVLARSVSQAGLYWCQSRVWPRIFMFCWRAKLTSLLAPVKS